MMNRIILNAKNNYRTTRIVSQVNKIKYTKAVKNNKTVNALAYANKIREKTNYSKVSKRSFNTFTQMPTPEDPNNLMFVILALAVCYLVVKR